MFPTGYRFRLVAVGTLPLTGVSRRMCDDEPETEQHHYNEGTGGNVATSELDKRPARTVDPHDEPSAEWGWHGTFPRGIQIAGWLSTIFCFLMLIGNHHGRTEDIWLIGVGVAMAIGLIYLRARRRTAWRR
ncbi:DUF2631 domain-containing protein [Goodfellowiella coeruleoviolacea]|uniref:DUF2631 domain-containing protein n=1 Tax=Goodfellowiella coeruleoviolacea TaxID=334858 RepID=A0AAE3GDK9_9PSEU|nr:DUF2631 domain-containing protein [Goodfellowiella coeruleoviolacea]MCP2165414.1 Protein of unknown function (DUF2631) [Goodfellowiella coeruleoviolacea]